MEIQRLKPLGDPTVAVECASLGFVNFTYLVVNRGDRAITGLKLGTRCGCEEVREPPNEIPPGGSAPVSFRLRAPFAGKLKRTIPLLIDGASAPIAEFDASLRVKFEPPGLVPPSESLSLTFIHGDQSRRELIFEAIEAKREKPWICGLELSVKDQLETGPMRVDELSEVDPDLTRRRYFFPLANRSLPIGRHLASATFKTLGRPPRQRESAAIWFQVVDRVAIVPNPLVIQDIPGAQPSSRRVRVVNRLGKEAVAAPIEFDRKLLRVSSTGHQLGSTMAFEITPVENDASARETQVVFDIGGMETRELLVRFAPPGRK